MRKLLPTILVAEDDEDDIAWVLEAFDQNQLRHQLTFVRNGRELLALLHRIKLAGQPLPGLILIDLHMPVVSGQDALEQIKSDEQLRHLPVLMMTNRPSERTTEACYQAGANSCISKPEQFGDLVELVAEIDRYWLRLVTLPG